MLLFVVISIFVAGLMVGRTPEYVGKEDRSAREVKMAMPRDPGAAADCISAGPPSPSSIRRPVASMAQCGAPHGFTEVFVCLHLVNRQ